jgi:hypothetical protein
MGHFFFFISSIRYKFVFQRFKHYEMKKILFSLLSLAALATNAQTSRLAPANADHFPKKPVVNPMDNPVKTLLCLDTIRYPQVKEQLLFTDPIEPTFYIFEVWQADQEAFSQTFFNSGTGLSIRGIEFFGSNSAAGTISVRASIYSVNAQNNPVAQLATGTVPVVGTTPNYYRVNFANPLAVSTNYAVVIEVVTTNGILDLFVNDIVPNQPYDENLSRFKSIYYPNSNFGQWVSLPAMTTGDVTNFPQGPYDFEPIVAPLVSYTINTTATVTPDVACLGTPVNFSGSATPTNLLNNRMYNFGVFESYFLGATSDSTYAWDTGDPAPLIWNNNTTYTYPAPGTYPATMFTVTGFWELCIDSATDPVTINPLPTVTAGASNTSICPGASTTLNASGASTYTWDNNAGSGSTTVVSPSSTLTYTVTGIATNTCTNTATVTIVVNPLTDAAFNYPSNTICTSTPTVSPTVSNPGTFSSLINTTSGQIDVANSTPGSYTISHTTNGTCPDTDIQSINITDQPDASFTYSAQSFCSNETNPSPVFGAGASGGLFSSTAGLSFVNANTGEIDLASSSSGSYVITNTIAAAGGCPSDVQTYSVTINETPTATVSGGGTACGDGTTPVSVNVDLTGVGPWNFAVFDGTNTTPVLNQTTTPYVFNASNEGVYTVTFLTNASCGGTSSGSATVAFNPNPNVAISPIANVCDNAGLITINATPSGGNFTGTGMSGDQFDPAQAAGSYTITYTYTDANGCIGTATNDITVYTAPIVTLTAFDPICLQDGAITLSGGLPAGGEYTGTDVSAGTFTPTSAGSATVTYSYTDLNQCSSAATQSILVNDCASIEENNLLNVTVSPNPASDVIVISTDAQDAHFTVFTEEGKTALTTRAIKNGSATINVSQLASGIYFIKINAHSGTETHKVIKH